MNKVFLDTDIFLDVFFPDRRFSVASSEILSVAGQEQFRCCVSSLSIADIAYVLGKNRGKEYAFGVLRDVFRNLRVLPVNDMCVYHALRSACPDFEDAMQIACADYGGCDCIVTANARLFRDYAPMPVFTPEEFLAGIRAANDAAAGHKARGGAAPRP